MAPFVDLLNTQIRRKQIPYMHWAQPRSHEMNLDSLLLFNRVTKYFTALSDYQRFAFMDR